MCGWYACLTLGYTEGSENESSAPQRSAFVDVLAYEAFKYFFDGGDPMTLVLVEDGFPVPRGTVLFRVFLWGPSLSATSCSSGSSLQGTKERDSDWFQEDRNNIAMSERPEVDELTGNQETAETAIVSVTTSRILTDVENVFVADNTHGNYPVDANTELVHVEQVEHSGTFSLGSSGASEKRQREVRDFFRSFNKYWPVLAQYYLSTSSVLAQY